MAKCACGMNTVGVAEILITQPNGNSYKDGSTGVPVCGDCSAKLRIVKEEPDITDNLPSFAEMAEHENRFLEKLSISTDSAAAAKRGEGFPRTHPAQEDK